MNKLVAFNTEIGTKVPGRIAKFISPIVGTMSLYGFYDAGWVLDTHNPIGSSTRIQSFVDDGLFNARIDDAGVGIRSDVKWPFWNFTWRLDSPLWVSNPEVNGETKQTDWRYNFSIIATF